MRQSGAKFFLPTEDEWYKAAYYVPGTTEHAYRHFAPPEFRLPIIEEPLSGLVSPTGMAGFADDIWEWTETPVGQLHRALRCGSWYQGNNRQAAGHFYSNPQIESRRTSFRIGRRTTE